MLTLTIPAVITTPGGIEKTPFGDKAFGHSESTVMVTLPFDDDAIAKIRTIFPSFGGTGQHMSIAQLAAEYSLQELSAALSLKVTSST